MSYDYGSCHVCGGRVEEQLTEQTVHAGQEWVLIRSVPTGVCTKCGEQIFRWQVSAKLEEILKQRNSTSPDHCIQVPVYAF